MLRRILFATAMVAATTAMAIPAATAGPTPTGQCPSGGVKVSAASSPATVPVTDMRTTDPVEAVVTITGAAFTISAPADAAYSLTDASWCLKSSATKSTPTSGTGLTGYSPSTNKKGVPQDIGYVVLYNVKTALPGCYEGIDDTQLDLAITGPLNTYNNITGYGSTDGTCSGTMVAYATLVTAADSTEALATCLALDSLTEAAVQVNQIYPGLPADYYGCIVNQP